MIGADPALTRQVWRQLGKRPFILAFNPATLRQLGDARDRFGEDMICPFPAEQLVGHFCYRIANDEALIGVRRDLGRARKHFGLADNAPLTTAVVGNHSSMCVALKAGWLVGCESLEGIVIQASFRERKLACLVGTVLEEIDGIDLVRLPGNLDPEARSSDYDRLIARIRSSLDRRHGPRLAGRPEIMLKLPIAVRLYTKSGSAPWEMLVAVNPLPGLMRETDALIQRFVQLKIETLGHGPEPRAVLVKMLGTKAERHSPADVPLLTVEQHDAARLAGIEAILLDARCGILFERAPGGDPIDEGISPVPVYGV